MQIVTDPTVHNLTTPYTPVAIYYEAADIVEYVRRDAPAVHRRIDEFLTLIFDMKRREELIGFQLKGFKNFYLQDEMRRRLGDDFMYVIAALERAVSQIGDGMFDPKRREAYRLACGLAAEDNVKLHDLPKVA